MVMLTKELLNKHLIYEEGLLYWKEPRSNAVKNKKLAGYVTKHNYNKVCIFGKQYYAHRLIFMMHYGYMPKFIDHIDCNKLNNKIENLREVTHSQNIVNMKTKITNTSGVKGVSFDKSRKKWMVRITYEKKIYNLGRFDDLELAELVILEARDKYHQQYANFN